MKFIEAEELKKEIYKSPVWTGLDAIARINAMPSIDIVFCKECKYEPICNHSVQHTTYDAHSITIGSKTVEWCSYGERSE